MKDCFKERIIVGKAHPIHVWQGLNSLGLAGMLTSIDYGRCNTHALVTITKIMLSYVRGIWYHRCIFCATTVLIIIDTPDAPAVGPLIRAH